MAVARSPTLVALTLAAAILACNHNVSDGFPHSVGFQPLEPAADASWPAAQGGDLHPAALGAIVTGTGGGHHWAHARGYLHAPLAKVYAALGEPAASRIHSDGDHWDPTFGVEPGFPVSFRIHYTVHDLITVSWEITYRAGPLQGTDAAPLEVGLRYQKTWGTVHIDVQSGSIVAAPVDGDTSVTSVELVCWLNADGQGESDVAGTVQDWWNDLSAAIAALP
jgi:hypothetical protein